MMYEAVFKKEIGFYITNFEANNDEEARLSIKAIAANEKSRGEKFFYPLVLKKLIPTH